MPRAASADVFRCALAGLSQHGLLLKGPLHPSQSQLCLFFVVSSASPALTLQGSILISNGAKLCVGGSARRGAMTKGAAAQPREMLQDQQLSVPPGALQGFLPLHLSTS